jgi:hypothetical protein
MWFVPFSLTPALSRWEREKRSQLSGDFTLLFHRKTENGFGFMARAC